MANTYTSVYNMTLPEIGSANNSWGQLLNDNFNNVVDPEIFARLDRTWLKGKTITVSFNTSNQITSSTANVFRNLAVGDRLLVTGADSSASIAGKNRGEFVISAKSSNNQTLNMLKMNGSDSAGFRNESSVTVTISLVPPNIPERSGTDSLVQRIYPFIPGEIRMYAGFNTESANGVTGLGSDNSSGNPRYHWLYCNGGSVNTYTYRDLHKVISNKFGGTAYNAGTTDALGASSTFKLPDLRGRVPRGLGQGYIGSATASGTAPPSSGTELRDTTNLGSFGGADSFTLSIGNIPQHNHNVPEQTITSGTTPSVTAFTTETAGAHRHRYTNDDMPNAGSSPNNIYRDGNTGHAYDAHSTGNHNHSYWFQTTQHPAHSHTGNIPDHSHEVTITAQDTGNAGSANPSAVSSFNPYLVVNFIIAS